jgi:transposase
MGEACYLIDSTSVRLSGAGSQWARFSDQTCGAKVHVVYDAGAERPIYAAVSAANVNDITAAKSMPIEAGATYVFDLGYYDFAWWAKLDTAGCRIVTRFKSHTKLNAVTEQAVESADGTILSDRTGLLPLRMAKSRKNPFIEPVREVMVKTPTGKVLRILSNDLEATAEEIAELYKRRWAIELFFRWVKQTLKIRHFLGNSENAVRIQIAVALIAYLLLQMAKESQKAIKSPLAFARLVRTNLMHLRQTDTLIKPPPEPKIDPRQLSLI